MRNLILNITGRALELVFIIIFVPGMNLFLLTGLGLELELHHPIYPSPCSEDLEYKFVKYNGYLVYGCGFRSSFI